MPSSPTLFSYRGNQNLKRSGAKNEWTPELIQEYIKCKNDVIYFAEKYFKIVTEDGLGLIKLRDYQKEMIMSMTNNRRTIANMARQAGKALSLETKILTPKGIKKFKDIHIGDEIYSVDGKKTKVVFETEIMHNHKCFNMKFNHGETITCDEDHVWTVEFFRGKSKKIENLTTKEIIPILNKEKKAAQSIRIKISDPIDFEENLLSIDPYILGMWLGDGTSANGYITAHIDDLEFYKKFINIKSTYFDLNRPNVKSVNIDGLYHELNLLNLLKNKHIPNNYIFNSVENRIALLQGLMDTDGSVTHSGSFEFYQKNKIFIEQVRLLLSTLGIKSKIREKIIKGELYHTLSFCTRKFDVFRLERKLLKVKERTKGDAIKNNYFYIESISETEIVPVKCIQVDNPSHLFLCGNTLIPTHNTECFRVFLTHTILFNEYTSVGLLANKADTANEILSKIQLSYQALPTWLQLGIVEWNKGSFVLENNSRIIASSTSSDSIRGWTFQIVVIDEAAHIEGWEDFYTSVYPTISAGKKTKMIMASTPNGLNHFYEFWEGAGSGKNDFYRIFAPWWSVPGRDEDWKKQTLMGMNNNMEKFEQEYCAEFLGSSGTLIAGWKLKQLMTSYAQPVANMNDKLKMYEKPVKETRELLSDGRVIIHPPHSYVVIADVSRGKGLDYSAFSIIDVTQLPYRQVCVYRDNQIAPADYAAIIYKTATSYNNAAVLCEINDIGEQIGYQLLIEYGYENVLCTESSGRAGKKISFGGRKADKGIRTTKIVKSIGCSTLKLLVEQDKFVVLDKETINEFNTFSRSKDTYKAETGKHDDMVMGLVLFAWLTDQGYFKELTDINTASSLREITAQQIDNNLIPFGFINDALTPVNRQEYFENINMNIPFRDYVDSPDKGKKLIYGGDIWEVQ